MSDFKKFTEELKIQVERRLGDGYSAEVHRVTKVNTGATDALIVSHRDKAADMAGLVCYLTPLFQEYRDGRSAEDIAADILEAYSGRSADMAEAVRKLGSITDYECCRHRIYFRLVNTEKNRAFLEDKVHYEILDLSMVFYILVSEDNGGVGAVPIQKRLSEAWGIPAGEIRKQAEKNTPELFPAKVQPLVSVMEELLNAAGTDGSAGELQAAVESRFGETKKEESFILTNTSGLNGFSAVLYPGALKNFSDSLGRNLYVLPSSLHEALLIPAGGSSGSKELGEMVREVNRTVLAQEEFLSDSIYYYDREKNEIKRMGVEDICVKL